MEAIKKEALNKMMKLCSLREKCRFDIEKKLRQEGFPDDIIDEITEELTAQKFIDENRYAKAFINDKFRFSKWGRNKIRYRLESMKIPKNFISDNIEKIDENEYKQMVAEEIRKKEKSVKEKDKQKRKYAILRFAQSRGYEIQIVSDLLEKN